VNQLYKLTDAKGQTYGATQWGDGIEHTASGIGELCGPGWIHAYAGSDSDPEAGALLAVLLNPTHGNFDAPRLWLAEGEVGKLDHGLKVGCTRLRTLREVPLPSVSLTQRVRFGILCALAVCPSSKWGANFRQWAAKWLAGADRTAESAWAAEAAAREAWEAWAARAAAWAARAAAWAAREAAWAAAWAARATAWAPFFELAAIAREATNADGDSH
jgi:hypothetical protein